MKMIRSSEMTGPLRDYLNLKTMVAAISPRLEAVKGRALQQLVQILAGEKSLLVLTKRNVLQDMSHRSEHKTYNSEAVRRAEEAVASAIVELEVARSQAEQEGKFRSIKTDSIRVQILPPATAKRARNKYGGHLSNLNVMLSPR